MQFFFEVLIGGLLSGVMYALVALGFVLIYKASGVFNFAQGAMVFFAALTAVGLQEKFGLSLWLAIPLTMVVMVVLGLVTCTSSLSCSACRPSCRAASSSAWHWRARWPRTRR